jgi:hypothetical protein
MRQSNSAAELIGESRHEAVLTITRPSNVTAYTALDVIGVADGAVAANAGDAIHVFPNIGPAGGMVRIISVDLFILLAAVPAGMAALRLFLFNAPPTAILDNAAMDLKTADRAKFLGFVDLTVPVDYGSSIFTQNVNNTLLTSVKLADGSTTLYGLLQTVAGFTPTSGEVYQLRIRTSEA